MTNFVQEIKCPGGLIDDDAILTTMIHHQTCCNRCRACIDPLTIQQFKDNRVEVVTTGDSAGMVGICLLLATQN